MKYQRRNHNFRQRKRKFFGIFINSTRKGFLRKRRKLQRPRKKLNSILIERRKGKKEVGKHLLMKFISVVPTNLMMFIKRIKRASMF